MIPATYNFKLYEGATFSETWTRSGVASAVGWSAALDIRETKDESSTRYLGLTSGSGITLSSDGSSLIMSILITATQTATLQQAIVAATGKTIAYYDLKLTRPDATVEYLLRGSINTKARITT